MPLEEMGVGCARNELGVAQNAHEEIANRVRAMKVRARECIGQPDRRLRARRRPRDHLGEHRVVVNAHLRAVLDTRVEPQSRSRREGEAVEHARRWREAALRVLGIETRLDSVAAKRRDIFLRRKCDAARHFDLEPHEVEPRHALGHGMLDLEAGVYFQEKELSGRREQEFDGSGAAVANRFARGDGGRTDRLAQRRGQRGARRFLDDLLVSPLDRAFALVEMDDTTVCVAEDLHFDVARAPRGSARGRGYRRRTPKAPRGGPRRRPLRAPPRYAPRACLCRRRRPRPSRRRAGRARRPSAQALPPMRRREARGSGVAARPPAACAASPRASSPSRRPPRAEVPRR